MKFVIIPFELSLGSFKESLDTEISLEEHSLAFIKGDSGSGKSVFLEHIFKQSGNKQKSYLQNTNACPPLSYKVKEIIALLSIPKGDQEAFIKYISRFFDIDLFLNKRLKDISGGERSFISLITALFSKKDVIMLDEHFNMMSADRRASALALIKDVCRYKTVFVISHFIELFEPVADYTIELNEGIVSFSGLSVRERNEESEVAVSLPKKTKRRRLFRYFKDDAGLIVSFTLFIFCFQFLMMFSVSGIENEKNQDNLNNVALNAAAGGVSVSERRRSDSFPTVDDKIPGIGVLDRPIVRGYFLNLYTAGSTISSFGYHHQYIDLPNEEPEGLVYSYVSSRLAVFTVPTLEDSSSSCVGKCSSLLDDEIIIGRGVIDSKFKFGLDFEGKDRREVFKNHDYVKEPLSLVYVYNESRQASLQADYNAAEPSLPNNELSAWMGSQVFMSPNSIKKRVKVVGYERWTSSKLLESKKMLMI